MSGLFKPTYRDKKTGKLKRVNKWYAWYLDPRTGRKCRKPLCADKSAAQAMLTKLLTNLDRQVAGIADPYEDHRAKPLEEHLADWQKSLESKARPRTWSYPVLQHGRVKRILIDDLHYRNISEINASQVYTAISALKSTLKRHNNHLCRTTFSLETINGYLQAVKQFARWLVQDQRLPYSPLQHLKKWNSKLDVRRSRRALTLEEIYRLLETAKNSPQEYRGLSGWDRHVLYQVALGTGLRVSELASLRPHDFKLDGDPPLVQVDCTQTKNQQEANQPLSAELVVLLRDYLRDRPDGQLVWPAGTPGIPRGWGERASGMIEKDLRAARKAWLAEAETDTEKTRREASFFLCYRSAEGFADFHALRATFITLLARSGVHPRMAQQLARHSDINLTMRRYTKVGIFDAATALESLPSMISVPKKKGNQAAG